MTSKFSATVWKTLSKLNVNEHTEKKGNLTYLSWAWAWGTMMEHYPNTLYEFDPPVFFEDGSCEVWVTVTIAEGEEAIFRRMALPVMDHRNNAIKNPDARAISDTRMRCLVKCLAMFGLGHYIYAGEDLPGGLAYTDKQKAFFDKMLSAKSALGMFAISQAYSEETLNDLFNSFEAGQKTKMKAEVRKLEKLGGEVAKVILENLGDDNLAVIEVIEDEPEEAVIAYSHVIGKPGADTLKDLLRQMKEAA